jgi:inner membrane protein import complex subunit Tim44-like protein
MRLVLLLVLEALRPGGGHSFSGGGSHSSGGGGHSYSGGGGWSGSGGSSGSGSGGGGDSFELVALVFQLMFRNPHVGIPVLVFIVIGVVLVFRSHPGRSAGWTSQSPPRPPRVAPRRALAGLRDLDPDFSLVLFEDFVYSLFAEAHLARGKGELARLSAYLRDGARAALGAMGGGPVSGVVVGAMTYEEVRGAEGGAGDTVSVTLTFEANYDDAGRHLYAVERWTLERSRGARTPPPERARALVCPNCAAALTEIEAGKCAHCGQQVDSGQFGWVVSQVEDVSREAREPELGGGYAEERGTDLPTVVAPDVGERLAEIQAKDPAFSVEGLGDRVRLIFTEMQRGWSDRDWQTVRPYLSDTLFQTQLYWIEAYLRQKLRNVTRDARILTIELARIESDRWYDAVTLRIFARSLDYTVTETDKLVGGSRTKLRPYTEYWTVIRGSARSGAARLERKCPNCAAELKVNMAGSCEYCQAKVTTGEFDWVLSRIEQDDVYAG